MLKNNYKTYTLLGLVIIVWSILLYRLVVAVKPTEFKQNDSTLVDFFIPEKNIKRDTFSIQTVNRDPFLGTLHKPKKVIKRKTNKPKKEIQWPQINYNGVIENNNNKQQIFVITTQQKQYLVKKGQSFEEIKLVKGNKTKIWLSFKGKQKVFFYDKN